MYGGVNPASGEQLGLDTGDPAEFADYAELEEAFFRQMEHFASIMIYRVRRGEIEQRNFGALPVWSVLTEDCIARGRDITNFGAFVDIGLHENGLIHVSKLGPRGTDPSKVLKLHQQIRVRVLDVDFDRRRIALGLLK